MAAIKSMSAIADKWTTVTPQRTTQYKQGVENPSRDWKTATNAAAQSYTEGVQKSVANKRFESGVNKAGTEKWQKRAASLGADRWGSGVAASSAEFTSGFSPYRDTIEKTTLPARYPRGDARNYERVKAIGVALNAKKLAS